MTHPVLFQNIPGKCGPDRVGDIITDILSKFRPLVLIIAEARGDIVDSKTPDGYTFVPGTLKYKKNPRVSMLIKEGVTYKVEELKLNVPTVCVKIESWRLIGYYREWNLNGIPETDDVGDQLERLRDLVQCLKKKQKQGKVLALGDTNVDLYNVSDHQKKLIELRSLIEDELIAGGWLQMIKDFTRSQQGQRSSCIDHVFTTHYTFVDYTENQNESGTDHNLVGVHLNFTTPVFKQTSFVYRNINGIKDDHFEREFLRGHIEEVYECREPDLCLQILENKIKRVLNRLAPEKTITTHQNYAPWMTSELKKKARKRNKLRKEAVKSGKKEDWLKFKEFRSSFNKEKVEAKNSFYTNDLQSGDSKQRWAKVQRLSKYKSRSKGGKNVGAMEIVSDDGHKMTDPETIANFMNLFFKDKVTRLRADLKPDPVKAVEITREYLQNKKIPNKVFSPVTTKQVKDIIRGLSNTGALGRDGISTKVIKKYSHVIGPPLTHLVNLCLQKKKYPAGWKLGLVRPLPKGGNLTVAKNWGPIILNCSLSKVLESVINQQLMSHMESEKLYSPSQHAYRCSRSVSSALQDVNTIQADLRNKGKITTLLTTDVSAGFNLISKQILIPKMRELGLDESACEILADYLTKRRTKTCIENCTSLEIELDTGVGEGSCVGPTFFSCGMCCISNVAKKTEKRMKEEHGVEVLAFTNEFADDGTGILGTDTEDEMQLAINIMLEEFLEYYSTNGLKLNLDKCAILVHRIKPKTRVLYCGEVKEDNKEKEVLRLLGLWIDKDLSFETHCGKTIGACYEKLGALTRLVPYLPQDQMINLVKALILSSVEWCAEIWLRNKKNQIRVQRLLNAAMRMILKKTLKDRMRVSTMLVTCGFLNATNLARRAMCCNLRRVVYSGTAPYSRSITNPGMTDRQYDFRELRTIRCNWFRQTRFVRQSFMMEALQLYNGLGVAGKYYESEKVFRESISATLVEKFGNDNL